MIAVDLGKQQTLDSIPKAIQQINFNGNLSDNNILMFFIIEEAKETILDFRSVLWMGSYYVRSLTRLHVLQFYFVLI